MEARQVIVDKDKKYTTRSGLPVEIYATNRGGDYPVHGAILKDGTWYLRAWTSEGFCTSHGENLVDLIEVKPRIQFNRWRNIYPGAIGPGYKTLADAEASRAEGCLACIQITIDCEEGEGL